MKKSFYYIPSFLKLILIICSIIFIEKSEAQWTQMDGPNSGDIWSINSNGSSLFAGTFGGGIFRSDDNGFNWHSKNNRLRYKDSYISSIIISGNSIFACSNLYGVFKSTNNGESWDNVNGIMKNRNVYCLFKSGGNIYAGTQKGIFMSTDSGDNWVPKGLTNINVNTIIQRDSVLFAGTDNSGVFMSTDYGMNWVTIKNNLASIYVYALQTSGNRLFAGTFNGIYYTSNSGANWYYSGYSNLIIRAFSVNGSKLFAATSSGIVVTTNNGNSWDACTNGITQDGAQSVYSYDSVVFAGTKYGLYKSTNRGELWSLSNNGISNEFLITFTACNNYFFSGSEGHGIYRYDNVLNKWMPSGLQNTSVFAMVTLGNDIFAGTTLSYGIYRSTNNGLNWSYANNGLTDFNINCLVVKDYMIFAGANSGKIFRSTNNGNNWINLSEGIVQYSDIWTLTATDSCIYAGSNGGPGGIFISTNDGLNWISKGGSGLLGNNYIRSILVKNNYVFVGTAGGVFRSSNNCETWSCCGLANNPVYTIMNADSNIIAGTYLGVFISSDNGNTWENWNQGFSSVPYVYSLGLFNGNIIAGTYYQSAWKRQLPGTVGIKNGSEKIPLTCSLYQNYPNPFNPSTNIKFEIHKNEFVVLKIIDIQGREIEKLMGENLNKGTYDVIWNASHYPSGIYFYKLEAGDFSQVRKMILLK